MSDGGGKELEVVRRDDEGEGRGGRVRRARARRPNYSGGA